MDKSGPDEILAVYNSPLDVGHDHVRGGILRQNNDDVTRAEGDTMLKKPAHTKHHTLRALISNCVIFFYICIFDPSMNGW